MHRKNQSQNLLGEILCEYTSNVRLQKGTAAEITLSKFSTKERREIQNKIVVK